MRPSIEKLQALRASVADKVKEWSIMNPDHCFGGHVRSLLTPEENNLAKQRARTGSMLLSESRLHMYGFEEGDAMRLAYPGIPIPREQALRMLDHVIAGGNVDWGQVE